MPTGNMRAADTRGKQMECLLLEPPEKPGKFQTEELRGTGEGKVKEKEKPGS